MSDSEDSTAPPSPDYVTGPEYPPSPDFVLEPVYPEFMPPEDEVLAAEELPLPAAVSPTADSPGYVPESDPEEDPEEDDDEDPEEDPADYPADGGDDGDDKNQSSDDKDDDDVDIEEDTEEEHPAPADSTAIALPAVDHAPSAEETKPFETDESMATPPPHPAYRVTARISIRDDPPTPFWSDTEIPSPPLPPVLSPLPVSSPSPASPIRPLGYRAAMIRLRVEAPYTSHSLPLPPPIILSHTRSDAPSSGTPPLLPILLPTSPPPLHLLSTDHRVDRPEVTLLPRKRLGITLGLRYEVGESSSAPTARPLGGSRTDYGFVATMDREIMRDLERDVGYGITDTWDEILVDMPGTPATDDTELGQRMTEFITRVRQDTYEIYTRLDDEQSERELMDGRLNMLYKDRCTHARTARLMEAEARMSREAWGRSMTGYRVLIDLILHRSSINNSASLSNKFGGFYFIFKFGISGLLHQVITTIADRIRDKDTSQSKQNSQSSSTTFIYKTLIIPSFLDSCFISSTVSEDKRVMLRLDFKICAKDKNFSSICAYTTMMLPRVQNHHGGKCCSAYVRRIVADFSHVPPNEYSPSPNDKKQWTSKLEYKFQDKENSEDIFSFGSALEDFICVVFVPDRNISSKQRTAIETAADYRDTGTDRMRQAKFHLRDTKAAEARIRIQITKVE
ncbi:hypothetical protein Tco_1211257 [Tanacetum coccineum]